MSARKDERMSIHRANTSIMVRMGKISAKKKYGQYVYLDMKREKEREIVTQ